MKRNAQGRPRPVSRAPRGARPLYLLAMLLLVIGLLTPLTAVALEKPQDAGQQATTAETTTITQETAPADVDGDRVEDASDNCLDIANSDQADADGDGLGDACDDTPTGDTDGDGVDNSFDNCLDVANADQADTDGDGAGDACDDTPTGDPDGDGVDNSLDNCVETPNANQTDTDGDGVGDACDDTPVGDPTAEPAPADTSPKGVNNKTQTQAEQTNIEAEAVIAATGPTAADITIDHTAAGPYTYDHDDPADAGPYNDPKFISKDGGVVESLEGGDFACGDHVIFLTAAIVDSSTPAGAATARVVISYDRETTSGRLVGYDEFVTTFINPNDTGNKNLDGNEATTLVSVDRNNVSEMLVTLDISGLDQSDQVIVRTDVLLVCRESPQNVTGNIHSAITGFTVGGKKGQVGQQDVPLKSVGDIAPVEPTTQIYNADTDPDEPVLDGGAVSTGTSVYDTVNLTGAGSTATGSVTYSIYTDSACSVRYIDPATGSAWTSTVTVTDGVAPQSASVILPAGTYDWQAEYSGDFANSGGESVCGTETMVVQDPDLDVLKTADDDSVSAGEDIGFNITVSNGGPGTAFGVTLNDPLPSGDGITWSIDSTSPDPLPGTGCAIATDATSGAQTLNCAFGDLAPGASVNVHITSPTDPSSDACVSGVYENIATADATNHAEVTSTDTITVECPDLAITKTANPVGPVNAGDSVGFDIVVTNNGPGIAQDVTLTDPLPNQTGLSWDFAANGNPDVDGTLGGDCEILPVEGTRTKPTLDCAFGDLAAGESVTVRLTSDTTFESCATLENVATVDASNQDSVDSDLVSVVVQCPDLTITKLADDDSVSAGDQIGFTITVLNDGAGTAYGVDLADDLPDNTGLDWSIDFQDPASTCAVVDADASEASVDQQLACAPVDLAANGSLTVHVTSDTTADRCGTIDNTASYTTANDGSGQASDSITVNCPDLAIVKTSDPVGPVNAGDTIGFDIIVTNNGPGIARAVTLIDPLPTNAGLSWSIATNPDVDGTVGGDCEIVPADGTNPPTLSCAFGDLADNASVTVELTSTTTTATCGTVENKATADASNDDPVDSSVASVTVNCPSGIATAQTAIVYPNDSATLSGVSPNAEGTITFELHTTSDCSGTATYSETVTVDVAASGFTYVTNNNPLTNANAAPLTISGSGSTWYWEVTYSGDSGSNTGEAVSTCGTEQSTLTITNDAPTASQP